MAGKSKKRKKLDILYRKLRKCKSDSNNTFQILQQIQIEHAIKKTKGEKSQRLNIPEFIKNGEFRNGI